MSQGEPKEEKSLDLQEVKQAAVKQALQELVAGRRRVDPKVRKRMRRLRQRAKAKRKQKRRKRKPIRKEKGKWTLDVSPFAFNKSPEAKRSVMNPVTRNKVKVLSLSGHQDMRAYKVYKKHYDKWKVKWKAKYEKVKARAEKLRHRNKRAAVEEQQLRGALVRLAYQRADLRDVILDLLIGA